MASAVAWGVATVLYTRALRHGGALEAALFKNLLGVLVLGVLAALVPPSLGGGAATSGEIPWLLGSGVAGMALGDWLYFVALTHVGVGRTLILTMATPVLTALVAWPLLGERLAPLQWAGAILVAGGGVLAESRRARRSRADAVGVAAALGATLAWTAGNLSLHWGLARTPALTGAAWRLAGGAAGMLVLLAASRRLAPVVQALRRADTRRRFLWPALIGTCLGLTLLAAGFKWAKQGVASALASAVPLVSIPLAVAFLGERPGWRGWLGATIVTAGVALMGLALA